MRTVDDLSPDELRAIVVSILDALSARVWSPDTLDQIADVLRGAGLKVADAE